MEIDQKLHSAIVCNRALTLLRNPEMTTDKLKELYAEAIGKGDPTDPEDELYREVLQSVIAAKERPLFK